MTIGSILITLAILLLVALYIAHPLLEKTPSKTSPQGHVQSSLLAERERLLTAIEELDFDHDLGKVTDEEYAHRRQTLLKDGAAVLQQLEEAGELDTSQPAPTPTPTDDIEALIAARRRELKGQKRVGEFCPSCGEAVQGSDKFCANCGADI